MGKRYMFFCSNCAYHVMVSGGWDSGFYAETVTIHCKTCKSILDVGLDRRDGSHGDMDQFEKLRQSGLLFKYIKCPHTTDEKHDIDSWGHASTKVNGNWTCPKCGGIMDNSEFTVFWD